MKITYKTKTNRFNPNKKRTIKNLTKQDAKEWTSWLSYNNLKYTITK